MGTAGRGRAWVPADGLAAGQAAADAHLRNGDAHSAYNVWTEMLSFHSEPLRPAVAYRLAVLLEATDPKAARQVHAHVMVLRDAGGIATKAEARLRQLGSG